MKTAHWFDGLFQSAPDLIALLLPAASAAVPSLGPDSPGDELYRFEAPELKAASHRLDGAFWPRSGETSTPEQPVVLLEVQMHGKAGFKHRLAAQSFRFLQLNPQVQHLEVVVVVPRRRLRLGPDRLTRQLEGEPRGHPLNRRCGPLTANTSRTAKERNAVTSQDSVCFSTVLGTRLKCLATVPLWISRTRSPQLSSSAVASQQLNGPCSMARSIC